MTTPSDDNSSTYQYRPGKMKKSPTVQEDTSADGKTVDSENSSQGSDHSVKKRKELEQKDDFSYFKLRYARDALLMINLVLTVFTMVWMTNQQTTERSQIKSILQNVVVEEGIGSMIKKEVDDFKSTYLKPLEQQVAQVEGDNTALQENISSSREEINRLMQLLDSLKTRVDEFPKTIDEIKLFIGNLSSQLSEEIKKLNKDVGELNNTVWELDKDVRELDKDVEELKKELQNAKEQHKEIKESLKQSLDSSLETAKQVEEESRRVNELSKQTETLGKNLDNTTYLRDSVHNLTESYNDTVKPNLFKKDYFMIAFMFLFLLEIFSLIFLYRLHKRFGVEPMSRTVRSDGTANNLNIRQILDAIPTAPPLDDAVCIISFYEDRQNAHKRLLASTNLPNCRVVCHVVSRHDNIHDIPRCKVYLMCVEFSERHIIIEEPGLGLGSLHRTTYSAIMKLRGQLIILYTRDPGSRNLKDNERFNNKIYPATHQPELVELNDDDRFFSLYDELTNFQKTTLRQKILERMT